MQFDNTQAFDALAKPTSESPFLKWVFEYIDTGSEVTVSDVVDYVEKFADNMDDVQSPEAFISQACATIAGYTRWGPKSNSIAAALQSVRFLGKRGEDVNIYRINKHPIEPTERVPFGETVVGELDRLLELRLGAPMTFKARWWFSVTSGVLRVHFQDGHHGISKTDPYPVAAATKECLQTARDTAAKHALHHGVPNTPEEREIFAKRIARACSPNVCSGYLNLGLYMVSAWEYARRELVRSTGDPKSIPNIKPFDDDSIIDCYRAVFDLGPFRLDRVIEINHRCLTRPGAPQHKFKITMAHEDAAKRIGTRDPSLAPCGECGGAYKDHTFDKAIVVVLTRDTTGEEADRYLTPLQQAFDADGIDGIIFMETAEKFRIQASGSTA
jgi:hypothetical protein